MNCYINSKVKSAMQAEGLTKFPHETGGLLLGYRTETSYVITAMVGPGPRAAHELLNFEPDYNWQTEQCEELWQNDNTLCYLGDWHTHPNGSPYPSSLDAECMQKIAVNLDACCPDPLMVIIGGDCDMFECWNLNGAFRGLKLIEFEEIKEVV